MKRLVIILVALGVLAPVGASASRVRIKDFADFNGVRDNQLVGVGLVTGLQGTGDKTGTKFTTEAVENLLKHYGINLPRETSKTKNNAVVVILATVPPFAKPGTRIDASIHALGDATSLEGGSLIQADLRGIDGQIYGLAQGPVSVGGFLAGGGGIGGSTVAKGQTASGRLPNGVIIEQQIPTEFTDGRTLYLTLRRPDMTNAARLADEISRRFRDSAYAVDGATVEITIPKQYRHDREVIAFMSLVEQLTLEPDEAAIIIVSERTGTIIAGDEATVAAADITHGSITVTVDSVPQVSQPQAPFTDSITVFFEKLFTKVEEQPGSSLRLEDGAKVGDIVRVLNEMGVPPRDIIMILQALKEAGKIQAQLQII
ncbi:MAG: flagellar basal body P-ring protein FlgI [Verrucomicrobia bacterium]|nr:flagellar basal body P-ring protein FlgI [Verrucomicrobiota bacterium]